MWLPSKKESLAPPPVEMRGLHETRPLKKEELKKLLNDIALDRKIEPQKMEDFLSMPKIAIRESLSTFDVNFLFTITSLGVLSLGFNNFFKEKMPTLGKVGPFTDAFLLAFEAMSEMRATQATVMSHLPHVFLSAGVAYGLGKTAYVAVENIGRRRRIHGREKLDELIEEGGVNFSMNPKHTAAFVERGDQLAEEIAKNNNFGDFIQIGSAKPKESNIWGLWKESFNKKEIYNVLDRCDFEKAGEALIMPVEDKNIFLPEKENHDMTVGEIAVLINILDAYCDSKKCPRKKIFIIGARDMEQVYVTKKDLHDLGIRDTATLVGTVEAINKKNGGNRIEIVDPTMDVILPEVIRIANGRTIVHREPEESEKKYVENFFNKLNELGYHPTNEEKVTFNYNVTTAKKELGKNDICAILDQNAKDILMLGGIPEENILVVPQMIVKYLTEKMKKS